MAVLLVRPAPCKVFPDFPPFCLFEVAPEMGPLFLRGYWKQRFTELFVFPKRFFGVIGPSFLYPPEIPATLEVAMRDVYQVLREKEVELLRVRQEVEALQATLPLLVDDEDIDATYSPPLAANDK